MKKVKFGIVGLGRLGIKHAHDLMYSIPTAELTAACSPVEEELDQVRKWGITDLYEDYSDMIANADIDAVAIITPSHLHAEQVIEAMDAGKHVFCEKPLGVNVEECLKVEKVVDSHPELKFQLGFMRRYDPSYAEAKRKIDAGEIGDTFLIKTTSNDPLATFDGFRKYAPHSGGPWLDMSVHDIDLALWLMGGEIESIYAIGGAYHDPTLADVGCADAACALMKFKDGAMLQMHVGYSSPHGYQVETEIFGKEANLRIAAIPNKDRIQIYGRNGVNVECQDSWPVRFADAFRLEKEDFVDCILNDRKPGVTAQDGTITTKIAVAATEAFETGKLVHL